MRRTDNLPSLLGSSAPTPDARDAAIVERAITATSRWCAVRLAWCTPRGRVNDAIEDVATEAMLAGTNVMRQAVSLATLCPVAEPLLRTITEHSAMALGRIVSDAARDLRD